MEREQQIEAKRSLTFQERMKHLARVGLAVSLAATLSLREPTGSVSASPIVEPDKTTEFEPCPPLAGVEAGFGSYTEVGKEKPIYISFGTVHNIQNPSPFKYRLFMGDGEILAGNAIGEKALGHTYDEVGDYYPMLLFDAGGKTYRCDIKAPISVYNVLELAHKYGDNGRVDIAYPNTTEPAVIDLNDYPEIGGNNIIGAIEYEVKLRGEGGTFASVKEVSNETRTFQQDEPDVVIKMSCVTKTETLGYPGVPSEENGESRFPWDYDISDGATEWGNGDVYVSPVLSVSCPADKLPQRGSEAQVWVSPTISQYKNNEFAGPGRLTNAELVAKVYWMPAGSGTRVLVVPLGKANNLK